VHIVDRVELAALADARSPVTPLSRAKGVCALCRRATRASGVALSVAVASPHRVMSTVWGTDALSLRLEELQLGLAEGPIADAVESTLPVLESDLSDVSHRRWLWFAPAAVEVGAAAVFVLPLCAGEHCLGALSLYRRSAGVLRAEQYEDFRTTGDAATQILQQSDTASGGERGSWTVSEGTGFQPEIHQAVGVVMADLDTDAERALARLRGHAFAADRAISEVAHDVVSHRLHIEVDAA
jgi:hypothetical protein